MELTLGNFIIFLVILFALAALLRIDFFFTILYLFVGIYVLAQFWSKGIFPQLKVERDVPERAFAGDTIMGRLTISNQSRLPIPWLVFTESLPIDLRAGLFRQVITLGSKASYSTEYELKARKRGYYKIGPLDLQTGDILGIRKELTGRIEPTHLIVYPRIVPITELGLPAHSPQVVLPTTLPLFRDPARITGVREYVAGDNPRHIHWSATATSGQTLVKQFQPAIARDNAILLNLDRADYAKQRYPDPAIELAIVVAASLANHVISFEKLPAGLVTTAYDPLNERSTSFNLPPHKGQGQLMQILEVLARVEATEDIQFLEYVRRTAIHLPWGTTLIIITSYMSQELQETLLLLKKSGFQTTLVLAQSARLHSGEPEMPIADLKLPIFKIRREKDIEVWAPST